MKLQIDTTISFHRLMDCLEDDILPQYNKLKENADLVKASTYSRKEFAFSLISDCCAFQARLLRTQSFSDAYTWIDKQGAFKGRFGQRIHAIFLQFILEQYGHELVSGDKQKKNEIITRRLIEYLRLFIPEMWERFEEDIDLPLTDRTHCPFAQIGPKEQSEVYVLRTKKKCKESQGCSLQKMMNGEKERASKLFAKLKSMKNNDPKKTDELKKIEGVLKSFYEDDAKDAIFENCNKGIGDLIISLETHQEHVLVTTNYKESSIISEAIGQDCVILRV